MLIESNFQGLGINSLTPVEEGTTEENEEKSQIRV